VLQPCGRPRPARSALLGFGSQPGQAESQYSSGVGFQRLT